MTDELTTKDGQTIPNEERTECEVYSRVMGYYRPVSFWNKGKAQEFKDRLPFVEPPCGCGCK